MQSTSINSLISILIPCFNAERWIRQCIQSAVDQSYPHKEILVLDDGSSDASWEIISSFGDRVRVMRQSNAGANIARNRLTEVSRGEWIQYLDADNFLLPRKLECQMACALSQLHPADVVYSPTIVRYEHSETQRVLTIESTDPTLNFIRWMSFDTTSLLWRRKSVVDVGMWREEQPCCQEHELILRLIEAGARFVLLNEPLAVYRDHNHDRISKRDIMRTAQVRMALSDRIETHLKDTQTFTHLHRRALAASRAEVARLAYFSDPTYAVAMFDKATKDGGRWLPGSQACPLSYRIAAFLFGLSGAETLAAWKRKVLSAFPTARE